MGKNFLNYDEQKAFNEIVFENRNKEYGAYALRTEANIILQKAFFIGISLFVVLAIFPLIVAKLKPEPKIISDQGPFIFKNVDRVDEPEIIKPAKVEPQKIEQLKTQSLEVPTPTRDAVKEVTVSPKVDDAVISTENRNGIPVENQNPTVNTTPKVDITPKVDTTPKVDPNAIPTVVDVEADFSGGINAFRNKVSENFDVSAVNSDSGEIIKGTVTFIVEKDGSISNIKVNGANADFNKEAEKTIKKIKGQWIPAKFQGQKVRSYFRMPLTMQFE